MTRRKSQSLLDKNRLETVFNRPFTQAQDNYKAKCPFHSEKTPSFYVHQEELLANCFGCGTSGYIDVLVSKYLKCDMTEARRRLGIDVKDRLLRKTIHNYKEPPKHFPESWLAPFERSVHKYVLERGFTIETLKSAQSLYDKGSKRQVFPHRDGDGGLLGVAGRTCVNHDPKWRFYWGYQKGRHPYKVPSDGYDGSGKFILVEGIFDALWLYQHGYKNVVSSVGTKITIFQLRCISEWATELLVIGDNDESGRRYDSYVAKKLRNTMPVHFCALPKDIKDVQELDEDRLEYLINNAQNKLQKVLSGVQR